jgi:hypothetical protein
MQNERFRFTNWHRYVGTPTVELTVEVRTALSE